MEEVASSLPRTITVDETRSRYPLTSSLSFSSDHWFSASQSNRVSSLRSLSFPLRAWMACTTSLYLVSFASSSAALANRLKVIFSNPGLVASLLASIRSAEASLALHAFVHGMVQGPDEPYGVGVHSYVRTVGVVFSLGIDFCKVIVP